MKKKTIGIREVARYANVSIATVSNVIHNKGNVRKETRTKVLEAISALNYYPNPIAQSLKGLSTKTIGVVISDITNPFFSAIVKGIEDELEKSGINLILCNSNEDPKRERAYLGVLESKKVDGIILSAVGGTENIDIISRLTVPVVYIDRVPVWINSSYVKTNNEEISYEAVKLFIDQGIKNIGIIYGLSSISTSQERINGYKKCLMDHGIKVNEEYMVAGDSDVKGGGNATKQLLSLDNRPEALFVMNSLMTIGSLKVLKKKNISIPGNIRFIGYHDQEEDMDWNLIFDPPLTVVRQPSYEMGKESAKLLLLNNKETKILNSNLRIRESTGHLKPELQNK